MCIFTPKQVMVSPKIILNEDYLDLRKCPENNLISRRSNTWTYASVQKGSSSVNIPNLKCDGIRLEKELINCGLKKLVTSYNATAGHINLQNQLVNKKKMSPREKTNYDPRFRRFLVPEEQKCLKSTSDISLAPKTIGDTGTTSTPMFPRKKTSTIEVEHSKKNDMYKNKFTMTKTDRSKERVGLRRGNLNLNLRQSMYTTYAKEVGKGFAPLAKEYTVNQHMIDPRLCEKYSVLKMPWKRTWTIPVISPKSSRMNGMKALDHIDRQTYLYDDGTEIDSAYVEEKQKQIFSSAFQTQFMGLLFLGGGICGILLVSLLIWFIFGFDFFRIFFKPRDVQDASVRQYIKYLGGGTVYLVTSIFRGLGKVLAIPTHNVYQAQERRWPVMQRAQYPDE